MFIKKQAAHTGPPYPQTDQSADMLEQKEASRHLSAALSSLTCLSLAAYQSVGLRGGIRISYSSLYGDSLPAQLRELNLFHPFAEGSLAVSLSNDQSYLLPDLHQRPLQEKLASSRAPLVTMVMPGRKTLS